MNSRRLTRPLIYDDGNKLSDDLVNGLWQFPHRNTEVRSGSPSDAEPLRMTLSRASAVVRIPDKLDALRELSVRCHLLEVGRLPHRHFLPHDSQAPHLPTT